MGKAPVKTVGKAAGQAAPVVPKRATAKPVVKAAATPAKQAVKPAPKAASKALDKAVGKVAVKPLAKPRLTAAPKPAPKSNAKAAPKSAVKVKAAPAGPTKQAFADGPDAAPKPRRVKIREKVTPDRLEQLVEAARKSLEDDKAENLVVLDVTGRASFADRLIIATGQVERQIEAMASHVQEALGKIGMRLRRDRIQASPDWVLIDCGDLIIHLFKPEAREIYALERMWGPGSPAAES